MLDKLKGFKTYITLGVIVLLGALDAYNGYCVSNALTCKAFNVPEIIYVILGTLGIYTRSQVGK
jgi:hypothetical protein